jgi:hypothetical protein
VNVEHPYLVETRKALTQVLEYLAVVDAKLVALEREYREGPPTSTVDEVIAQAETATAIYKALEPELKIDVRTVKTRLERVVKAHSLEARFPDWSRDVGLARYMVQRLPNGQRRLQAAYEALG